MIRAVFAGDRLGLYRAEISGHAGTAPRGEDLICAGVSAMVQATLNGLDHFLPGQFGYGVEEGAVTVILSAQARPDQRADAHKILKTLELGLQALREEAPEAIEIHNEEVEQDDSH